MNVVVDGISRYHKLEIGHMQAGCVIPIRVVKPYRKDQGSNNPQLFAIGKGIGQDDVGRDLIGNQRPPERRKHLRGRLLPHLINHLRQGNGTGGGVLAE